jgi:FlaA1/EpsC-like NDP-sugar epimerase
MSAWIQRFYRILLIAGLDILCLIGSGAVAFWARFDFTVSGIPREFLQLWYTFLPMQICITLLLFLVAGMYNYVWRAVGFWDASVMGIIVLISFLVNVAIANSLGFQLPRGVYFIMLFCEEISMVGMRGFLRFWTLLQQAWGCNKTKERIMLIGAGSAGQMLLQEIKCSKHVNGKVRCVVDDDPDKKGKYLWNIPVIGGRERILDAVKKYGITQIIFAIPSATPQEKKEILDICTLSGCHLRILPGLYQMINGEVDLASIKDVAAEDLLGREPVQLNNDALNTFLGGKVVLVTGSGSIGSELCRQIAYYRPRTLIILDIYENNAYDIQQELQMLYHRELDLHVEIASIRDKQKFYDLFAKYRPQVIFHAAAHKHVPLMEDCPEEAVKNNIFGTYHVVRAAEKYGAEKFVMISTDKAVNPTNFMGATKRFCEMILQSRSNSNTQFCAVRFGNVLGSNGSVVPLFKKQIAAGGPVTLTDKRIVRYFMTISEAAQLVLQAGAMAKQGQIFVLDMGEPVKILDLAENLIRLSGLQPYTDIEIKEVGLRPGEKLYEELLMKSEHLSKTDNAKIFIEQQTHIDPDAIMADLLQLDEALARQESSEALIHLMRQLVNTYLDPKEVNRKAAESWERGRTEDTPVPAVDILEKGPAAIVPA